MSKGLSFESFGGVVRKSKQTLYTWIEKHPEWKEAKAVGESCSRLWWENIGKDGLWSESWHQGGSKSLNATVWIFNMKNRFGWRDKRPDEDEQPGDAAKPEAPTSPAKYLEFLKTKQKGAPNG